MFASHVFLVTCLAFARSARACAPTPVALKSAGQEMAFLLEPPHPRLMMPTLNPDREA